MLKFVTAFIWFFQSFRLNITNFFGIKLNPLLENIDLTSDYLGMVN